MDYETKAVSRQRLRQYAVLLRKVFDVPTDGSFPVLYALETLGDVFYGSNYVVVEDYKLPPQMMARCVHNDYGGYTIEIRQSVYDGAYRFNVGAFLGFICHEICHIFLFEIGYTPVYGRRVVNGTIPAYCSVEWQAKALCGEVMIPFDESHGLTAQEIVDTYHVSKAFAKKRLELEKR